MTKPTGCNGGRDGWLLGLTHMAPFTHYWHDSGAALVHNGRVIAAVAEERFTRVPHYAGYPACALNWLLQWGGCDLSEIETAALPWPDAPDNPDFSPPPQVRRIARLPRLKNISFVDHQRAHAFCAYAYAPFESGTVISLDGMGLDGIVVSGGAIYRFENGRPPDLVRLIPRAGSTLGEFYGAITLALGWEMLKDEGKTMALAAFGNPNGAREALQAWAPQVCGACVGGPDLGLADHGVVNGRHLIAFGSSAASAAFAQTINKYGRENTAAAAQSLLEERVLRLVRSAVGPRENLCLAGGLFLNIHLVRQLREEGYRVFAYPNPGDGGTAVGAALAAYHDQTGNSVRQHDSPVYLGPSYSRSRMEAAIAASGAPFQELNRPAHTAARLLESGEVLGLFQGRAEWGPRALGNRSVLADPRNPQVRTRINAILKKRESFQPFGPMMTPEAASALLENAFDSPFMIDAFAVNARGRRQLAAAVHEDGTVRPQILRSSENPFCFELLQEFGQRTGVEALINTSLNIHGEAMCLTPEDALHLWRRGGVDALLMPPFLVRTDPVAEEA
jgi:carbamoyltransferase